MERNAKGEARLRHKDAAHTAAAVASQTEIVRDLSPGTHICLFYETPQDLLDLVVPYLRHGLEQNEFCVWITGDPISGRQARQALRRAIPDLDRHVRRRQFEILDARRWYLATGKFEPDRLLSGWAEKEHAALRRGYAGLRVTGDAAWVAGSEWGDFLDYEAAVGSTIESSRITALCTYSMQRWSMAEVIEVVARHRSALIRRNGKWDVLQTGQSGLADDGLAWLASFAELSPNPLVECDLADGSVSYINSTAKRLLPDLAAQGQRHPWLAGVAAILKGLDESGASSARREVKIGALYYEQSVSRAPGKQRARVFGLDITDRKAVERHWSVTNERMEELVAQRTQQLETANSQLLMEIAERRRAEQSLRESRERLDMTLEAAQVGLFDWNLLTNETFWSPYHEIIFNYEPGVGRRSFEEFARRVHPEDLPRLEEAARRNRATRTAFENEYRVVWSDGSIHWVAGRCRYYYDAEGRAVRMMGVAIDITDRKRTQEELRKAKEIAVAASAAKSQFLANMSHELRTPMNAILGMTELALTENLPPMVREYLETSKQSADSLLAILNDILDLSRIEAGGLQLEAAPFHLHGMVQQVVKMLGVLAHEKGLALVHELGDAPQRVVGDSLRLRQVLANLVGNAVKFTDRGSVTICAAVESREARAVVLRFAVIDTGIGIAPEEQKHIFSPFAQAAAAPQRHAGGTGLGLTIAEHLVRLMGGRMWVESEPGKGSTFSFTVKLDVASKAQKTRQETASRRNPGKPRLLDAPPRVLRVLLAEDTVANQKLVVHILSRRGHVVEVVDHGAAAVERVRRGKFDVILMDVRMPGMDGLEATAAVRKLRSKKARLPIIALTAHAFKSDERRCLAAGMDAYLSKPVKAERLVEVVERLAQGGIAGMEGKGRGGRGGSLPAAHLGQNGSSRTAKKVLLRAAPNDAPRSAATFELEPAVAHCAGNYALFQDMVDYFINEVDTEIESMQRALGQRDMKELARLAHRLKGTVCFLGAPAAMELLTRLEAAGTLRAARERCDQLEREILRLKTALAPHRKKSARRKKIAAK